MLLHCSPIVFDRPEVLLPSWIRSPCNLVEDADVFIAAYERHHSKIPALLISPFDPDLWSDLWRIDIDIKDSVGVTWRILRILEDAAVDVLCSESSAISNGRLHRLSFICSMYHYRSENDSNSLERRCFGHCSLPDLYAQLLSELIEDVAIRNRRSPRLQIRRISTYHAAKESIDNEDADLLGQFNTTIKRGKLCVSNEIFNRINAYDTHGKGLRAITTCDVRDRAIHIVFSAEGVSGSNCRIIFDSEKISYQDLLRVISERSLNILRSQMRPGAIREDMHDTNRNYKTLTLFVRDENEDGRSPDESILKRIEDTIHISGFGTKGSDWLVSPSHLYDNGKFVEEVQ